MWTHLTKYKTNRILISKQLKVSFNWHLIGEESNTVEERVNIHKLSPTVTTRQAGCFQFRQMTTLHKQYSIQKHFCTNYGRVNWNECLWIPPPCI